MTATGYTRQSAAQIVTSNTIQASHFNNEYNQLQSAFNGSTGHDHSGGTGLGQLISLTTAVSGILPIANGGTGSNFSAFGYIVVSDAVNTTPVIGAASTQSMAIGNGVVLGNTNTDVVALGSSATTGNGVTNCVVLGDSYCVGTNNFVANISDNTSSYGSNDVSNSDCVVIGNINLISSGAATSTVIGGTTNTITGNSTNTIVGGTGNILSSGNENTIIGGNTNSITAGAPSNAAIIGGSNNTITGSYSAIIGGQTNSAEALYSGIIGGVDAKTTILAMRAHSSGKITSVGDAQTCEYILRGQTTNNTQTEILIGGTDRLVLANDTTWAFSILIGARRTDADNESAGYTITGVIDRNANAASTALVGTITKVVLAEDTSAWDVTALADTSNGALVIKVTGENAKTINWVASVRTVETTG